MNIRDLYFVLVNNNHVNITYNQTSENQEQIATSQPHYPVLETLIMESQKREKEIMFAFLNSFVSFAN